MQKRFDEESPHHPLNYSLHTGSSSRTDLCLRDATDEVCFNIGEYASLPVSSLNQYFPDAVSLTLFHEHFNRLHGHQSEEFLHGRCYAVCVLGLFLSRGYSSISFDADFWMHDSRASNKKPKCLERQ